MTVDRIAGVGFFLFIPATLFLMLRMPLGPGASLGLAAAVIVAHRAVASRWVYARARHRCLYCAGVPRSAAPIAMEGVPELVVCESEAASLDRFLGFVARHATVLRIGILVPVSGYFLLGALAALGFEPVPVSARRSIFRVAVALSVMSVALLHGRHPPERPGRFPFPIHNLALLGVRITMRVFLGVGVVWLALEVVHAGVRLR
ncbi:MAG: hypothetical protein U0166_16700 [Acidobacteriota bacterium]